MLGIFDRSVVNWGKYRYRVYSRPLTPVTRVRVPLGSPKKERGKHRQPIPFLLPKLISQDTLQPTPLWHDTPNLREKWSWHREYPLRRQLIRFSNPEKYTFASSFMTTHSLTPSSANQCVAITFYGRPSVWVTHKNPASIVDTVYPTRLRSLLSWV